MQNKIIKSVIHLTILAGILYLTLNIGELGITGQAPYLWFRALHLLGLICWFAVLFYLPRLFVYHAMKDTDIAIDDLGYKRFCVMERRLYVYIGAPSMIVTVLFGLLVVGMNPSIYAYGWFYAKMLLVVALIAYHAYCGVIVRNFRNNENKHSEVFFRFFNEVPTVILITVIILVSIVRFY